MRAMHILNLSSAYNGRVCTSAAHTREVFRGEEGRDMIEAYQQPPDVNSFGEYWSAKLLVKVFL